ncbi:MAG: hypothetical protein HZA51_10535 [Planctomycetes bacterium]|nr:hypothetical protein [Planctomycetota bacterium]
MTAWMTIAAEWIGRGALSALPAVILIAILVRIIPARPATRHTLWLVALAFFVCAPMLPAGPLDWSAVSRNWSKSATSYATALISTPDTKNDDVAASTLTDYLHTAPTPPGTGARTEVCPPPSLAQATRPDERRSSLSPAPDSWVVAAQGARPAAASDPCTSSIVDVPIEFVDEGPSSRSTLATFEARPDAPVLMAIVDEDTLTSTWATLVDNIRIWPAWAWLIGAAALIIARACACRRFLRDLRPVSACPAHVQRMVADVAGVVGLTRAPDVTLVDNCISPMISCIGKRRLLLPAALWNELDDQGRRAVLFHELAHLRRRDHWVRWVESLISTAYWWNPLVWFVRNRVHTEAENCCDAWVTWLWPEGRSAYARALLKTTAFISEGRSPVPMVGIGMASVRARRFARRLTMVMTDNPRPRLSATGIAMAAILAAAGWLFTPAWSLADNCPDDEKHNVTCEDVAVPDAPEPAEPIELSQEDVDAVLAEAELATADVVDVAPVADVGVPGTIWSTGAALVNGAIGINDESGPRARRNRDNDEDADIDARIERLERRIEELMARIEGRRIAVRGMPLPSPNTPAPPPMSRGGSPFAATLPRTPTPPAPASDEKIDRVYKLSQGKLQALTQLMSRQDVPIMIRSENDGIHVSATPAEHEVFAAFVRMIDPNVSSTGSSRSATPAPRRSRAPEAVRVVPGVNLRKTKPDVKLKKRLAEIEERQSRRMHEREIENLQEHRDRMMEEADVLRERAEELRERAAELAGDAKKALSEEAQALIKQAEELAKHARDVQPSLQSLTKELAELEKLSALAGHGDDDDDADDEDDHDEHAAQLKHERAAKEYAAAAGKHDWYSKGYSLHMAKKYDEAIECFQKAAEMSDRMAESYYNIACGYSLKGDKDRAFDWLRKAWAAGYQDVEHMKGDSDLDNIRKDPRFAEFTGAKGDSDDGDSDDDDDDDESR